MFIDKFKINITNGFCGWCLLAGYVDGDITESLMIQPTKPVRNEVDDRSAKIPSQENSLPKTSGMMYNAFVTS